MKLQSNNTAAKQLFRILGAARALSVGRMRNSLPPFLFVLIITFGDLVTTSTGLRIGLVERNPVPMLGMDLLVLANLVLYSCLILTATMFEKRIRHSKLTWLVFYVPALVHVLIVLSNCINIYRYILS